MKRGKVQKGGTIANHGYDKNRVCGFPCQGSIWIFQGWTAGDPPDLEAYKNTPKPGEKSVTTPSLKQILGGLTPSFPWTVRLLFMFLSSKQERSKWHWILSGPVQAGANCCRTIFHISPIKSFSTLRGNRGGGGACLRCLNKEMVIYSKKSDVSFECRLLSRIILIVIGVISSKSVEHYKISNETFSLKSLFLLSLTTENSEWEVANLLNTTIY